VYPSGKVQGGLRGQTSWSWGTIDVLSVARTYRRQGVGSRLLAKAEEIARSRGCLGIRLDTTSFQAPDFYRRQSLGGSKTILLGMRVSGS
jgi:GNAT superfamily N-acetyltransferase